MKTFLAIWNPDRWEWSDDERRKASADIDTLGLSEGGWAFGRRKYGVTAGVDRIFLIKLGKQPRGIVASGWIESEPYLAEHWDGAPGKTATYVEVSWDCILDPDDEDALSQAILQDELPTVGWSPQAGGVEIPASAAKDLERLWAEHTGVRPFRSHSGGQGRQADSIRRRLVEDHAQSMLEEYYRERDWDVKDFRDGNPYDAVAKKAGRTLYLEAKGTQGDGTKVIVTRGEVKWASEHRGKCRIGIVSGVRFGDDGLPAGGTLAIHDWDPDTGTLAPIDYEWVPPERSATPAD